MFVQDGFSFVFVDDDVFFSKYARARVVVALDFDGVITDPNELKARCINELGYAVTPAQVDRLFAVGRAGVLPEDYWTASMKAYVERLPETPLRAGCAQFLEWAAQNEVDVFVVTSRYDNMILSVEDFLATHRVRIAGLLNVGGDVSKKLYPSKFGALERLRPDIFVDDSLHKLELVRSDDVDGVLGACTFVFFRNEANAHESPDSDVMQVSGFDEVKKIVDARRKSLAK